MLLNILGPWLAAPLHEAGANSSYLVSGRNAKCLLDCGPGAVPLLQAMNVVPQLDAVIISHMHHDHFLDVIPLATLLHKHGLGGRIQLFVPAAGGLSVLDEADRWLFPSENRIRKAFDIREYGEEEVLTIGDLTVTFQETVHSMTCYAARVTDGERTFVYSADTAYFPAFGSFAKGADLLLCEATFVQEYPGHLTGRQAGRMAAEAEAGRLILTHLDFDRSINEQNRKDAREAYRGDVELAAPGAVYEI